MHSNTFFNTFLYLNFPIAPMALGLISKFSSILVACFPVKLQGLFTHPTVPHPCRVMFRLLNTSLISGALCVLLPWLETFFPFLPSLLPLPVGACGSLCRSGPNLCRPGGCIAVMLIWRLSTGLVPFGGPVSTYDKYSTIIDNIF